VDQPTVPARCVGIIGGMSPQSTVTYYQTIVRLHFEATGEHTYPRILIGSIPFQLISDASHEDDWDRVRDLVQAEGDALTAAGADFLLIATNTIHKVVPQLGFSRPLLSIFDAVARAADEVGYKRLGLTGTRFTMSDGFYTDAMEKRGLEVVIPSEQDQEIIHRIIYEELVRGEVLPESVSAFSEIGKRLLDAGADAVLLGCTELELLTRGGSAGVPILDTTFVHARAAWEQATGRVEYPMIPAGGT